MAAQNRTTLKAYFEIGILSLSYTSLIPILVEAWKDLDEKYRRLQESYQTCMALINRNT
ncbi:MAG: hypothetical protein AAF934_02380 [Bacteroidota bacterium]